MANGDIVVCDNVRFFGGEETNDQSLADALAALADAYVNDSFSCSHRAHVSTTALAHRLPAYAGVGMARELDCLQRALTKPKRPLWAIVGGAKVSSKIEVLLNLSQKVDGLIIGGAMAHTFLKAQGVPVGKSLVEDDFLDTAANILKRATCEVVLPIDGRSAAGMDQPYADVSYEGLPSTHAMFDIGPKTLDIYKEKLSHARTIIWNGPVGVFEVEAFQGGTCALAAEVARLTTLSGVITVAGGGDTLAALHKANVGGKLTFESTAGGAFLEWLEGKALPGVVALEDAANAV
jgi:phosphoglycerate kinase